MIAPKQEALERSVEKAIVSMLQFELGESDFPINRSDQLPSSADIECIVVDATQSDQPELINLGGKNLLTFNVTIELWSLGPVEDSDLNSERWNDVDSAMVREDVPVDVNLDRFAVFVVMAGNSGGLETGEKGRMTRRRAYTLKVQEAG